MGANTFHSRLSAKHAEGQGLCALRKYIDLKEREKINLLFT
jgi:hypothetical protein